MNNDDVTPEEFAEGLLDPNRPLPEGAKVFAGAAAAAQGRAMLLREDGSEEALQAALGRPGRVPVGGTAHGASPTVRGRVPEVEFAAFTRLATSTGRSQSELVREAIHKLLVEYKLVS
ncbi:hypothetical protein AX769_00245 [Frondihabitans sp. PAMC 28766]|nr:hypothetical protein AX769_00245 [Frondihabitans sp. PAMC 28766]